MISYLAKTLFVYKLFTAFFNLFIRVSKVAGIDKMI